LNISDSTQNWSIIILCYNEEATIKKVIEDALSTLAIISSKQGQLIVVNDGSQDNSHQIITKLQNKIKNLTYVNHHTNKGIGQSLDAGYAKAEMENVIMIPGDGQFNLEELIPYKSFPDHTFLSFYRVNNRQYNRSRKWLSSANRILNKSFIGIDLKDVNWVNAYKTQQLKTLNLKVKSSLVESEICAKLSFLGKTAIEVKSNYHQNNNSQSTGASYKIVKQAFVDIPKLIFSCLSFKRKVKQQAVTSDFKHVI